jgi:hypothetical protein
MSNLAPSTKPEISARHWSINLGVIALVLATLTIVFALTVLPDLIDHSRRWTPALYWEPVNASLAAPTRNWC